MPRILLAAISLLLPLSALAGDRAIIEFRDSLQTLSNERTRTLEADLDRLAGAGSHVRHVYRHAFHGAAVTIPREKWSEVAKLPYVKRVHPDIPMQAYLSQSVAQIGAPQLWASRGTRGKGVVIAVVDTGIDYNHPALGGGFGSGFRVVRGWDFVNDDADPMDDHGHGTHVAGIAAANSETLTGVAPEATLLAYKVLGATGNGVMSDIVAAVDRALDPDGDGDLADAADVINLSLGGQGTPDDPVSTAVENAIAKGAVVVAAIGNRFDFFSVGSPASAPHAITVGSSDLDGTISFFSSKGPNTLFYTIKPEVVAPGNGIVSAWPGGGTKALNGTSMAAPHVAGAAALLRAAHPDWTPADIKSALVSTAFDLNNEVMAQGAGRIDVSKADGQTLFLDPPTLGFGLAGVEHDIWSPAQAVRIRNRGSSPVTLAAPTAGAQGAAAAQWSMSESGTALAPGDSKEVTVAMSVDHRASPYPTEGSLSYGGSVAIAGVPTRWAFVKASRIRVQTDDGWPEPNVTDDRQSYRVMNLGEHGAESILPAGTYDVVTWIWNTSHGDVGLAVREDVEVKGSAVVSIAASDLKRTITPAAVDEQGVTLASRPRVRDVTLYRHRLRLVYPAGNRYVDSIGLHIPRFRTTDIPPAWKILVGEFYADAASNTLYAVQHPPLDGIREDVVLHGRPLHERRVRVISPVDPGERRQVRLAISKHDRFADRRSIEPFVLVESGAASTTWDGRVFLTPDVDPVYGFSPSIGLRPENKIGEDFEPTPLRLFPDGRIAFVPGVTPGSATQWHAPDATVTLGNGPVHPRIEFTTASPTSFQSYLRFHGPNGERRPHDMFHTRWEVFDGAGVSAGSGTMDTWNFIAQVPAAGPVRLEFRNDRSKVDAKNVRATYRAWFDTTKFDSTPPSFSALSVQTSGGAQADSFPLGSAAWLLFGIMDHQLTTRGREYKTINLDATRVEYRVSGTNAWIAAQPQLVNNDEAFPEGRPSDGAVYRCRIPALAAGSTMDVRITAEDAAGNRMEYTLEPAFAVQPGGPRTRAVRH